MKFGEIFHLGIVVENMELAVNVYEKELGYGPFEITDGEFFDDKIVNGKIGPGLPMKCATYRGKNFEIEIIEPTGPSIYKEFLDANGPGIHHVILKTDEKYQDVVDMAKRVSGRPPKLETKFPDGTPIVAYADLQKEAGILLEIGNSPEN